MQPRLIVHGGAWNIPDALVEAHLAGVKAAVCQVYPRLEEGLSALDAVEEAVRLLEADPTFDAGRGAFLNAAGQIELDALIMDGRNLDFGAVAAVQGILHPVSLARRLMEHSEHRFLVGEGAVAFARSQGIPIVDTRDLLTKREREFFEQIRRDPTFTTRKPFEPLLGDTVGAVALDCQGNLAAATSTGGTPRKWPGRVGDSPLVGAGGYADNQLGAASATGWGESIISALLSKTACDLLVAHPPQEAAQQAVQFLQRRVNGLGGVILLSPDGGYGLWHNTTRMAFAFALSQTETVCGLNAREALPYLSSGKK
ncbi:MAG: asparaginase [Calditrichaeota bacterium]|nr:MAG: asparaginase [Calditrichota bacterium]